MLFALLIAGIGFLLAGLLGIAFGIPVKEFSFGNTEILAGVIAACTGMIMLAFGLSSGSSRGYIACTWRWIRVAARRRARFSREPPRRTTRRPKMTASCSISRARHIRTMRNRRRPHPRRRLGMRKLRSRDRARNETPPACRPRNRAAAKQRRNLLFSSTSRKERERAEGRTVDPSAGRSASRPDILRAAKAERAAPATFEDAWPQPERARISMCRGAARRTPSTFAEAAAAADHPPAARSEEPPAVTVLKSGVVDGMAYSLYSDGSIEAQMPEGMMRFASIDELRAHLDQRT